MKTTILFTIGSLFSFLLFAQNNTVVIKKAVETTVKKNKSEAIDVFKRDYSKIDSFCSLIKTKYLDIDELSDTLTSTFQYDADKVRAIYKWMTLNISFDCKDVWKGVSTAQKIAEKYNDDNDDFLYELSKKVLRSKKGVCIGYAALFYEICKSAGLKAEIVEGAADENTKMIEYYRKTYYYYPNHAWNKVKINNDWYYIDTTWSSGSCDEHDKFTKNFNETYFLCPINQLYPTHVENKY